MAVFAKLLSVWMALAALLSAQGPNPCDQRNVIVDVLDAKGFEVRDLGTENFRAWYRGRPANIVFSGVRDDPAGKIVVLLEIGRSMEGTRDGTKWKIARAAALNFVSLAPSQASLSFITFAAKIGQSFSADAGRQTILGWINNSSDSTPPKSAGVAAPYAAIEEALKLLGPSRPGDAIYIITDGREDDSGSVRSRSERELLASGTRLFAFILDDVASGPKDRFTAGDLFELTKKTGGYTVRLSAGMGSGWAGSGLGFHYVFDDKTAAWIQGSTRAVQAGIRDFYVLTLATPGGDSSEPGDWKLEVIDSQSHKRADLNLSYPKQLPGCTDPAVR